MFSLLVIVLVLPSVVSKSVDVAITTTKMSLTQNASTIENVATRIMSIGTALPTAPLSRTTCQYDDDCNNGICHLVVTHTYTTKECVCNYGWLSVYSRCDYKQKDKLIAVIASSPFGGGWFGIGLIYIAAGNTGYVVGGLIIAICNICSLITLRTSNNAEQSCTWIFLCTGIFGVISVWIMMVSNTFNDGNGYPLV
jgi:hypothetical protein